MRPEERFGEVRWSEYFDSRIVVVDWRSDTDWRFVVERGPYAGRVLKAPTPLSARPEPQRVAGGPVRAW